MDQELDPIVGQWYEDREGQAFEVVAADEEENYIEIQYFGGDIDELDFDSWGSVVAQQVEQPEDWSGPYDDLERDDLGYTDMNTRPEGKVSIEEFE
jgi:hypothetical protein